MAIFRLRKVHEDAHTLICDELRLASGSSLKIKDHRGFVVAEIMDNGDIKSKGRKVKV